MLWIAALICGAMLSAVPAAAKTKTAGKAEGAKKSEVSLVAVGDNLMHAGVYNRARTKKGYNFDSLYRNVRKDIKAADLAIINQETVMVPKNYSSYPSFGTPYAVADAIAKAGFDVVTHATNHTMDRGVSNVLGTLKYWRKHHRNIKILGIHRTQKEADTITVVEKNGIRIAMLNYTYGLNGRRLPSGKKYLVDLLTSSNRSKILRDIKKAKKKSDFVIVFPHWGTEYKYSADSEQKYWTKVFLDAGVDLVIGTHPHVVEPYQMKKGKKGHRMLVYYSLGNFASGQSQVPRMLGGMAKVTIVKDKKGTRIKSYKMEALVNHRPSGRRNTVYKLKDYTEALAKKHFLHKKYPNTMTKSYLKSLYRRITGDRVK